LVLVVLALLIVAATAAAYFYRDQVNFKLGQGKALASEMKLIQLAVNKAIFTSYGSLQAGAAMKLPIYNGAVGLPVAWVEIPSKPDPVQNGRPTWVITLEHLRQAGLLSVGFLNDGQSAVSNGHYVIQVWRTPLDCAQGGSDVTCQLDGVVMLDEPIGGKTAGGGTIPEPIIGGAFNVNAGPDAAFSKSKILANMPVFLKELPTTDLARAYSEKNEYKTVMKAQNFTLPNPIPPPRDIEGLPGLRVGSFNFHQDELVRVDDKRNLTFGGNQNVGKTLSVEGDVHIGGKLPELARLGDPTDTGSPCVKIGRNGQIDVGCAGQVSLVKVAEGQACNLPEQARTFDNAARTQNTARYAALPDGSLAVCMPNAAGTAPAARWVPLQRFRRAGQVCGVGFDLEGTAAVDSENNQSLICKQGLYRRTAVFTSSMVLQDTIKLTLVPGDDEHIGLVAKPNCPDSGGGQVGTARIMLSTLEDSSTGNYPESTTVSGMNRYITDYSETKWQVHLERATDNTPLNGTAVASVFCVYP
jgi:hypothetical protein